MKTDKLFRFLYEHSQVKEELDGLPDEITAMFEELDHQVSLDKKKAPLSSALKEIGIDIDSLELDPEGFCASTGDEKKYVAAIQLLIQPDSLHKLAELGWVFADLGDQNRTSDTPEFKIRFLELTTSETGDKDKADETPEQILKAAREFATEPFKRTDSFKKPSGSGVGKASDGETPGTAKTAKESLDKDLSTVISKKSKDSK